MAKVVQLNSKQKQAPTLEHLQTLHEQLKRDYENFILAKSLSEKAALIAPMTEQERFAYYLNSKKITPEEYAALKSSIANLEKISAEQKTRHEIQNSPYKHFLANRNTKLPAEEQITQWRAKYGVTEEEFAKFEQEKQAAEEKRAAEREEEKQTKFRAEQYKILRIIQSAKIPPIFAKSTLADFKISKNNRKAAESLKAIRENAGFYIYGECGVGKTLLASIIANERAKLFKSSMFIRAVDVFKELNSHLNENAAENMRIILNTPCLIIDDLGAEKASEWTRATLFDILDYRYMTQGQTIITSNWTIEELFSEKRISDYEGKRIIRRIKALCIELELLQA